MNVFTVSVAGSERHDGEAPYTYAVRAADMAQAIAWAQMIHSIEQEDDDLIPVDGTGYTFAGFPPADCRYGWNDRTGVRHGVE